MDNSILKQLLAEYEQKRNKAISDSFEKKTRFFKTKYRFC